MKTLNDLSILLLQIRQDEETLLQEVDEFARFGGIAPEKITSLNAFTDSDYTEFTLAGYDALFIGGSSDASVLDLVNYPFVKDCKRLIRMAYDKNMPTFASCFGFQLAVEEFGGKVIYDAANMEMGLYPIYLNELSQTDPLLHDIPSPFWAVSGHKERAESLPPNATPLGFSERCPNHLFRFDLKPFYGFQFHPEVDREDLLIRMSRYRERYFENDSNGEIENHESDHSTAYSNNLVKNFLERIVLPLLNNPR